MEILTIPGEPGARAGRPQLNAWLRGPAEPVAAHRSYWRGPEGRRGGRCTAVVVSSVMTRRTCTPFRPGPTSHTIVEPSGASCRPACFSAETWRNTSGDPSAGDTKPNPFSGLNHFTLPRSSEPAPPPILRSSIQAALFFKFPSGRAARASPHFFQIYPHENARGGNSRGAPQTAHHFLVCGRRPANASPPSGSGPVARGFLLQFCSKLIWLNPAFRLRY